MRPVSTNAARFVGVCLAITWSCSNLDAQDKPNAPTSTLADGETGIIVLQDGGVLAGQVTHTADWYVVTRGGAQVQIATAQVKVFCHTLEEAYELQRQQLSRPTIDAHLALADWCLRYNLFAQARRELADARKLEPDHARLALLERRLARGSAPPSAQAPVDVDSKSQPQANQRAPAPPIAPDLPAGVVERFTRKVQPVLVNNCTTAGCHQRGGPQTFQLDRALLRGEANRRSTMHNLAATLALVDRAHPQASPLLTVPRQTHGGMARPILGPRQEQAFKHLADWVALVAPPEPADEFAPTDTDKNADDAPAKSAAPNLISPILRVPSSPDHSTANEAAAEKRSQDEVAEPSENSTVQTAAAIDDESMTTLKPPHRLQYGGRLAPWRPRDPFDPEIFNRQQRAQTRTDRPSVQNAAAQKH